MPLLRQALTANVLRTQKTLADLPGPRSLPFLGNFLLYLKPENKGRLHEALGEEHDKYGPMFRGQLGPQHQLHVCDPKLIEEVLRHEGKYPNRPSFNSWNMYRRVTGRESGPFCSSGETWKKSRTILNNVLTPKHRTDKFYPLLREVTSDFIARLRYLRDLEGDEALAARFSNETYKWSMEGIGTVLFEQRMGCLSKKVPARVQEFIDGINNMFASSVELIVGEELHRKLNTRFWLRHKRAWDSIFDIGKLYIDEKMESLSAELRLTGSEEELRNSLSDRESGKVLSYLLSRPQLSMEQIYANVTELFIAGVDTVANSLSFVLFLLAENPQCQQRLYEEIRDALANNSTSYITPDMMQHELPYLECVIKESLRLYPVVTMNVRILQDELTIDGYKMPKNTMYVMNHYKACRDPTLFSNPDDFNPDRWLRFGKQKRETFSSLPFGLGARSCLGKRIANMELHIAISQLSQSFRFERIPNMEMKTVLRTLLTPGKQLPVRFIDRNH